MMIPTKPRGFRGIANSRPRLVRRSPRQILVSIRALLEQSIVGFEYVADAADEESFEDFCRAAARRRRRLVESVEGAGRIRRRSRLISLIGRLHRTWLGLIAPAGDAALADEVDRGEAILQKRVLRLVEGEALDATPHVRELLLAVRDEITQTRDEVQRRRADLDWGVESLPPVGHGGHRQSDEGATRAWHRTSSAMRLLLSRLLVTPGSGEKRSLEELREGSPLLLAFLANLNRGARRRLKGFSEHLDEFERRDTKVVVVTTSPPRRLERVADENDYDFELLADPDGELAHAIDAIDGAGRQLNSTMLIGQDGEVLFVSLNSGDGVHAAEMLKAVDRYREWFPAKMGVAAESA